MYGMYDRLNVIGRDQLGGAAQLLVSTGYAPGGLEDAKQMLVEFQHSDPRTRADILEFNQGKSPRDFIDKLRRSVQRQKEQYAKALERQEQIGTGNKKTIKNPDHFIPEEIPSILEPVNFGRDIETRVRNKDGQVVKTTRLAMPVAEGISPYRRGVIGAFDEGMLNGFLNRTGIATEYGGVPGPGEVYSKAVGANSRVSRQIPHRGLEGKVLIEEVGELPFPDYTIPEKIAFGLGRAATDFFGDGGRQLVWEMTPPDTAGRLGSIGVAGNPRVGYPQPELKPLVNDLGDPKVFKLPGSTRNAQLGALGSMAAIEGMSLMSGNLNPLNIKEGMRPSGYSAISTEEGGDPRVSTNPVGDILQRHFLGRKGRILPWEQFTQEVPGVNYDDYQRYKEWQWGNDPNDLLNKATAGVAKFTWDKPGGAPPGLDAELNVMGFGVTPMGAAAAFGAIAAGNAINQHYGNKSYEEFKDLFNRIERGEELSVEDQQRYKRNAFNQVTDGRRGMYVEGARNNVKLKDLQLQDKYFDDSILKGILNKIGKGT